MTINRYSSRRENLRTSFFTKRLKNAKSYDRIAGYFSSSIIEIAGEEIEKMKGNVRIICNSQLQIDDVKSIKSANQAMRQEWCEKNPEEKYMEIPVRLKKLYKLLKSEKIQVKVIPNAIFGLIHGKAGVITMENGRKTAFLGSMNETSAGWDENYELAWEDYSEEAVKWVQDEFDFLWENQYAKPLSEFIIEDIKRISEKEIIYEIEEWRKDGNPSSPVIESPIYRREFGLWEHQKFFIELAFNSHREGAGARYVLADMVGLGKTIQLALAAQLMALDGNKPILIIAPKTLIWQWQEELNNLLDMPTAVWNGKGWVDENGISHHVIDESEIVKCPRRVGIISQGLITAKSKVVEYLFNINYECIIVDECHRARRKNLKKGKENDKPQPNNLMDFLFNISRNTKSMLLATATPVQLYPIEAWDLLNILSQKNDYVLGNDNSKWRKQPKYGLDVITKKIEITNEYEYWDWVRNPFPQSNEDPKTFGVLRRLLDMPDSKNVIQGDLYSKMMPQEKSIIRTIISDEFVLNHNPFIRQIVRRTREFLENNINPETNEPYLTPIKVRLFGESEEESIKLPPYLEDAYKCAEEFCELLKKRVRSSGFMKTLLLKRVGSTMVAGKNTAEKILRNWGGEFDEDEDNIVNDEVLVSSDLKDITSEERECLKRFVIILEKHQENDPKYELLKKQLIEEKWLYKGCIVFSQYFDSIKWVGEKLTNDIPYEKIGVYAGGNKSGIYFNGIYQRRDKEELKKMVKNKELKLLLGTDSASEGLNLQSLSTLINLDLPWNPTRLEQRKGRIQRIGQLSSKVLIYNMRYKDSVEDRVHTLLSERFKEIHNLFGQIPDVLEDVWVNVALNNIEEAKKLIDSVPKSHPFEIRYEKNIDVFDWESCSKVLDNRERKRLLKKGWKDKI